MDWGAFAGGVGGGLEQGQRIRAQMLAQQDALRARAARGDVARALMNGGQDPTGGPPGQGAVPVPMPGATPMPMGMGGPAAPAPMGGGQPPMPGAAPAPTPAAPAAGPPNTSVAVPPMLRAPGPAGGPQPNPGPQAPGGPGAAPQGGPQGGVEAEIGKAFQASKGVLKSAAQAVQAGNPGKTWKDPVEFLDAVDAYIKELNSVSPMEKIAAQAQIAGSRAQHDYFMEQIGRDKADESRRQHDLQHEDRQARMKQAVDVAKSSNDIKMKLEAMREAARVTVEGMIQGGENSRAGAMLQFRYAAQQAGLDEKTAIAELQAEAKAQGVNLGAEAGIEKAEIGVGKTPSKPITPVTAPKMKGAKIAQPGGGGPKPLSDNLKAQWAKIPPQNKAAAKKHLQDEGYDVSGLS